MEGVGQDLFPPPGYANPSTPFFASPVCGYITQVEQFTSSGSDALTIGFTNPLSWTSTNVWTSDLSGATWTCSVPGIYQITVTQLLTVENLADITDPVINMTINVSSDTTSEVAQIAKSTIVVPITAAPFEVSASVSAIMNIDVNSTMTFELDSPSGGVSFTSGPPELPTSLQGFSFNLIAPGNKGNVGTLIA